MWLGLEGRKHNVLEGAYLENHTDGGSNPISAIYSCVIFVRFLYSLSLSSLICKVDTISVFWDFFEDEMK